MKSCREHIFNHNDICVQMVVDFSMIKFRKEFQNPIMCLPFHRIFFHLSVVIFGTFVQRKCRIRFNGVELFFGLLSFICRMVPRMSMLFLVNFSNFSVTDFVFELFNCVRILFVFIQTESF
uniref:Uncharacterized protein n=1 Tax=Cacopsylla melanoneura TaxID=428564 RepID=A0A8D8S594_9HEMI